MRIVQNEPQALATAFKLDTIVYAASRPAKAIPPLSSKPPAIAAPTLKEAKPAAKPLIAPPPKNPTNAPIVVPMVKKLNATDILHPSDCSPPGST